MSQKGISSFFSRVPPVPAAGKPSKVLDAAPGTSQPVPTNENSNPRKGETEPCDGLKRRRLNRVIQDSPTKSDKELCDLDDDIEVVLPVEAVEAPTAVPASPVIASSRTKEPLAAEPGTTPGKVKEDVAAAPSAPAASSLSPNPSKKIPSMFMKPQPKTEKAKAAKKAVTTLTAEAPAVAGGTDAAAGITEGAAGKSAAAAEEIEDDEEQGDEECEASPSKPANKKAGAKKQKSDASKVDGVGQGALAAATKHAGIDMAALIGGRWKEGQPVPFELLANTFEEIAETSARLDIVNLLINCFRAIISTTPEDLLPAVYLCTNRVAPAHFGLELGIGESSLIKAVATATGRNEARIKDVLKEEGDLGTVAVKLKSGQMTFGSAARLSIRGVFKAFKDIATSTGSNCRKIKEGAIVKLLAASKGNEAGYIIRSLQAKLRIGLAEQSVLTALAHSNLLWRDGAKDKDGRLADRLEQASQLVKQAYSECPSYDVIIPAMLAHPLEELSTHCHFMAGVPIKPMLAKPTNSVGEVIDKFQDSEFTCEYKYDGERAQLHVLENGSVMIFSRNSENNTSKYPDIVQRVHQSLRPEVKSIVIDAEAVAYDKDKKKILPFQVLSTRKRKDVAVGDIDVQVCVFAFDCLYINGRSLLKAPLVERREALYGALKEVEGEMQFATAKTSKDVEELQRFLDEAVDGCTEGLIVKTMCDTYEPAKRSSHWLKLKKDYLQGVGDTIDVVPIGGFHGKGKRAGVFGAYLLAVYDPETETYQTLCKLGTGFSEEVLQQLSDCMTPHIIPQPRKYFSWGETLVPDVWFDAVKVWEVKAADLSISPVHKAGIGLVDPTKGISIRFPRLLRVRDDKGPEDATSAEQIADMYRKQAYHKPDQVKEEDGADDEDA